MARSKSTTGDARSAKNSLHRFMSNRVWHSVEAFLAHQVVLHQESTSYLTSKTFWGNLFKYVQSHKELFFIPTHRVIKELKQWRWKKRQYIALAWWRAPLEVRYGKEIGQWLEEQKDLMFQEIDDPCMNNFRVARAGRRKETKQYRKAIEQGCCGRHDKVLRHPSYGTFFMGCNFGH